MIDNSETPSSLASTASANRMLAGRATLPLGLGCMGMSEFYGQTDDAQSLATLHEAARLGVTHFDTADTYGFGHNEELLGKLLAALKPSERSAITVATKFGIVRARGSYERRIDNSPAYIRSACEASLKRLGVEQIDLFYCHRRNPETPLAEMMAALGDLVRTGKIAAIGLSEVSEATLREAHALHPVAALQTEYSLWERSAEPALLPATQELGIAFVAYSPLGRSFLTDGPPPAQFSSGDFRNALPRFTGDAGEANRILQAELATLAMAVNLSVPTLALAWILNRYPHVIAIPGTRRQTHLAQNLAASQLRLPGKLMSDLNILFAPGKVLGARYPDAGWVGIETA